jgi:hypothetical protein
MNNKQCPICGHTKSIDQFSLVRGKHSEDRKRFCAQCEVLKRKAKKHDLDIKTYQDLIQRPCSVCGCSNSKHIDKAERLNGVLCDRCWDFLKSILPTDDEGIITACYNYLVFRQSFPFWLKMQLSEILPKPETPLLDLMNEEASR